MYSKFISDDEFRLVIENIVNAYNIAHHLHDKKQLKAEFFSGSPFTYASIEFSNSDDRCSLEFLFSKILGIEVICTASTLLEIVN